MATTNGIYTAINGIMEEIGAIGKTSKNQQQGFMYRGIDAVMNAGELKIADGSYGTVKLYMNAGAAYFGETACDSFECRLNAGTVNVKSVECGTVKTDLNAGYANFEKIVCGDIYFKLNAGSADLKIAGAKAEYNISVDKNAGTCNLDGQTGTTDKKLTCKLNAGSLNASFGD